MIIVESEVLRFIVVAVLMIGFMIAMFYVSSREYKIKKKRRSGFVNIDDNIYK